MRTFSLGVTFLVAACAMDKGAGGSEACSRTRFPENPSIAAWSVDKFAGTYRSGNDVLYVTREGEHRFIVQRAGYGIRQLETDNVEGWQFHDGCGLSYQFVLPPDGPGGMLTISEPGRGASSWHRG